MRLLLLRCCSLLIRVSTKSKPLKVSALGTMQRGFFFTSYGDNERQKWVVPRGEMAIAIATEMVQVVAPADLQAGKFARDETTNEGRRHDHQNH